MKKTRKSDVEAFLKSKKIGTNESRAAFSADAMWWINVLGETQEDDHKHMHALVQLENIKGKAAALAKELARAKKETAFLILQGGGHLEDAKVCVTALHETCGKMLSATTPRHGSKPKNGLTREIVAQLAGLWRTHFGIEPTASITGPFATTTGKIIETSNLKITAPGAKIISKVLKRTSA